MADPGDVFQYANGNEYVITDGGPNFWSRCFLCGATACATADVKLSDVRCGRCWADKHELLLGQRVYELNQEYARTHQVPKVKRD